MEIINILKYHNMNELEKVAEYAEAKLNKALINAIKEAYLDGYKDGCNHVISNKVIENEVEYIDLGLPSGTLWASDYLRENGDYVFLPKGNAAKFNLPTKTQFEELISHCEASIETEDSYYMKFLGINGNFIKIRFIEFLENDYMENSSSVNFWIDNDAPENCAYLGSVGSGFINEIHSLQNLFEGHKLPVLLVK